MCPARSGARQLQLKLNPGPTFNLTPQWTALPFRVAVPVLAGSSPCSSPLSSYSVGYSASKLPVPLRLPMCPVRSGARQPPGRRAHIELGARVRSGRGPAAHPANVPTVSCAQAPTLLVPLAVDLARRGHRPLPTDSRRLPSRILWLSPYGPWTHRAVLSNRTGRMDASRCRVSHVQDSEL